MSVCGLREYPEETNETRSDGGELMVLDAEVEML